MKEKTGKDRKSKVDSKTEVKTRVSLVKPQERDKVDNYINITLFMIQCEAKRSGSRGFSKL